MKYSVIANSINILFLGLFLFLPIIYALNNIALSEDDARLIVVCGILFATLMFADWYHLYFTNSFKSIFSTFILGLFVTTLCISILLLTSETTIQDLISVKVGSWKGYSLLFKPFIVGIFMILGPIASIPRLLLIRLFTKKALPETIL